MPELRELADTPQDLALLSDLYSGPYTAAFPNIDERESLANMKRCLERKREGGCGLNEYHLVLAFEEGVIVGASVSDYLADVNLGAIEFLLVAEEHRGKGIGGWIHEATLSLIQQDARRAGRPGIDACFAEVDDPFRVGNEGFAPTLRARIWGGWGYSRLCFPYVQPPLSPDQKPVDHLMLVAKAFDPSLADAFPAPLLSRFLEAYLRWAMRIPEPRNDSSFRSMDVSLRSVESVSAQPLAVYLATET